MDQPRVWNKRRNNAPPGAVYVGRPTKWGNPFVVGRDGARGECVTLYEAWLPTSGLLADIDELVGKDLVCWCAPDRCHADVLLKYAAGREQRWEEAALEAAILEAGQ